MAQNIVQICRLCLDIIEDTNFQFLESLQMEMLKTVLVNLNMFISLNPTICCKCADTLQKCFDFKTTCLNSEDCLKTFINTNKLVKVKLEDVCFNELFNNDKTFNGQKICRLCFSLGSNFYISVNDALEDTSLQIMLESCVPELNFDLTNDSLVCRVCLDLLRKQYTFTSDCLESEKKIKMYSELKGNNSSNIIDLYSVRQFFEKVKTENKDETFITKFENILCGTSEPSYEILKNEEVDISDTEIKDEYSGEKEQEKRENMTSLPKQEENRSNNTVEQNSFNSLIPVKKFSCSQCNYSAKYKCKMESHMLVHKSPSEVVMFQCNFCDFKTKRHYSLKMHSLNHMDSSEVTTFKCAKCSYETKKKGNLREHVKVHSNISIVKYFKCNKCDFQTKKKGNLNVHMLQHDPTCVMYKCEKCNYFTNRRQYLKRHENIHKDISEVPTFKCNDCDFQTRSKGHLNLHKLKHVSTHELYKCNKCNYSTKVPVYFKRHGNVHRDISEVPTFKCNNCDYQTRSKGHLKVHMVKHNPTHELHKCNKCNYFTESRANLKRHENIHKDISEVPTFKCNDCDFQAKRKDHLKVHMLKHDATHGLYKCNKYNSYSTKLCRDIKIHENVHKIILEVPTFKCNDCDFQTRSKDQLKFHVVKHNPTNELYTSNKCNYSTKESHNLERHGNVHKDISEVPTFKCNDRGFQSIYEESLKTLKYI